MFKIISDWLYVCIYVDDITMTGSCTVLIKKLITKLHVVFAFKQQHNLDYFVGIEVKHFNNGSLLLSQATYIWHVLEKAKMDHAKPILTPLPSDLNLTKYGTTKIVLLSVAASSV